jgi:CRISPR-associated exonuclease Cas4
MEETPMTTLPLTAPTERLAPVLRVSDLRQWTYCPRVAWWTHVCPVGKLESFKMKLGLLKERRLQRLQRRRTLRSFGFKGGVGSIECNVTLFSPRLQLSGRLDLLLRWGASRFPVEIKFTKGPARLNHRLQLAGYAILLEEEYGMPVPHGYVVRLPDDTVDHVLIDGPLRDLAAKTLDALRIMIRDERIPPPSPLLARCADCEYRLFCGDVDVAPLK